MVTYPRTHFTLCGNTPIISVEKDIVNLGGGKGEITFVEDVERVAATLQNIHCNEIYRSSVCG